MRALFLTLTLVVAAIGQSIEQASPGQTAPAPTISVTDENGVAVSSAHLFLESPTLESPSQPAR
jgi:hypothetical protein